MDQCGQPCYWCPQQPYLFLRAKFWPRIISPHFKMRDSGSMMVGASGLTISSCCLSSRSKRGCIPCSLIFSLKIRIALFPAKRFLFPSFFLSFFFSARPRIATATTILSFVLYLFSPRPSYLFRYIIASPLHQTRFRNDRETAYARHAAS